MKKIGALLLWCACTVSNAGPAKIENVRLWAGPDSTRIVVDMTAAPVYRHEILTDPPRVAVHLIDARQCGTTPAISANAYLKNLRCTKQAGADVQMVLDISADARPKLFTLAPNQQYGHRLVIDLLPAIPASASVSATSVSVKAPGMSNKIPAAAPWVIAIDAGHGGADPGARGPGGTREKDVTLAIARKLHALINKERGMRAVLVRDGDYYIPLRQRMAKAREKKADLFISIHADAIPHGRARGSSVYTLSPRGASSEAARWLAKRENAADLIGGVSLDDKDDVLASVLLDLSQTATQEASFDAANRLLAGLAKIGTLHKNVVQQAGFAVLKSPDIPSVLVETAFISHREEERKLRDSAHQQKLARALSAGIRDFLATQAGRGDTFVLNDSVAGDRALAEVHP